MGNMVKFKNIYTGVDMWVAEERVEEYKAAGHQLAVEIAAPKQPKQPKPPKPPVKTAAKKTSKKK